MSKDAPKEQLHMLWPTEQLKSPPPVNVAAGYTLRTYRPEDAEGMIALMHLAGFDGWSKESLQGTLKIILPDGLFFTVHQATGALTATAMATHNPLDIHPFGGELGWVAGDPQHAGKGLGTAVCAAVTERFLRAGYSRIYIRTDDWRLPAIKIYLKLGYLPFLFQSDMEQRWSSVCKELSWPFSPNDWPKNH